MASKNVRVRRGIYLTLEQEALDLADELGVRLKARVRDKLEETYKKNIFDSYEPIGERGKAIQTYNKKKKDDHEGKTYHQKAANYHHTGTFLRNIHARIDGDKIKATVSKEQYEDDEDGVTTWDVYKWLTRGTRKRPKYPYYPVEGKDAEDTPWAKYVPTPKHNFNQLTIADMENYLSTLVAKLKDENSDERKILMKYYAKKPRKQKLYK